MCDRISPGGGTYGADVQVENDTRVAIRAYWS